MLGMSPMGFVREVQARRLRPGKRITYHVGLLMRDRQADKELHVIARAMMALASVGRVALLQRRLDSAEGVCEYVAVAL